MLTPDSLKAIYVSLKLSFVTTSILLVISIPLSYWLSISSSWLKVIIESLIALPLVLPPTVLGFYLLILLSPNSFFGKILMQTTGQSLVFNFSGLVFGSLIYSLPFVVRPIQTAFTNIPKQLLNVGATLHAKKLDQFIYILLPCAKSGIISGSILGFTHTLGEFGVVLMLGGNISKETKTISIAIFDQVEQFNYHEAHVLSACLLAFSFIIIFSIFALNRKSIIACF